MSLVQWNQSRRGVETALIARFALTLERTVRRLGAEPEDSDSLADPPASSARNRCQRLRRSR